METKAPKYIIVQTLEDKYSIYSIPQIWLLDNTDISIGNICDYTYANKETNLNSMLQLKIIGLENLQNITYIR